MKEKELVTLRQKPMKNGGYSLYLDYVFNGVRYKDYLKMYISEGKTRVDKLRNQETMKVATALKAKKIIDLQKGEIGPKKVQKDVRLLDYIKTLEDDYRERGHKEYAYTLSKIRRWLGKFGRQTTVQTMTKSYMIDFMEFLRKGGLAEGTVFTYFANLMTVFNKAYKDEIIDDNPLRRIDTSLRPKRPESRREYLTLEEVQKLAATPCKDDRVKRAFLFACFCGLRLGDVEHLQWENIKPESGGGWQVEATQLKTKRTVVVPLSENAISQLPSPFGTSGSVWRLPDRNDINDRIREWVKEAGINKHITFHCSRHTYATLLLTYGADLYTVSKLLGHTDVATTQIYAKVIDEKKRKAVDLIPSLDS